VAKLCLRNVCEGNAVGAAQIRRLGPMLDRFLAHFDDCFCRRPTREHLAAYVRGLLSDLPRKSAEPIALDQGVPVRTLQEFLGAHRWDHERLRDRLQQLVAGEHACEHSVGTLDDCGCPKKGDKTPGVQRQYCYTFPLTELFSRTGEGESRSAGSRR
jgi:SRSO17 transposase